MQTYYGKWKPRLLMLLFGALGLGMGCLWVIAPVQGALERHQSLPAALNGMTPIGAFGLIVCCCCAYGLIDSLSVYRISGEELEKRLLGRAVSFSWQSLTACRYNGQRNDYYTLMNTEGQRLKASPALVHDPQGEFRAALAAHVKPLEASQFDTSQFEASRQDFGAHDRIYNPLRGMAYVAVPFLLPIVGVGLSGLNDPDTVSGSVDAAMMNFLLFGLTAGLVCYGLYCYTWSLTIGSDAIASDGLLRHRRIRYAQVQTLQERAAPTRSGVTHLMVVEGAGQRITFTEAMPGYGLASAFLRARAAGKRDTRDPAQQMPSAAREPRQSIRIVAAWFGSFAMLAGLVFLAPAGFQIARQHALDTRGVTVKGRVVDYHTVGRKHPVTCLDYEYVVNGQTFYASDSVSSGDSANANGAAPGQPVDVTYLPGSPALSRPADSDSHSRAAEVFQVGCIVMAFGGGFALLLIVCVLFMHTRRRSSA